MTSIKILATASIVLFYLNCGGGHSTPESKIINPPSDTYYYGVSSSGDLNAPVRIKFTAADPITAANSIPMLFEFMYFGDLHSLKGMFNPSTKTFLANDMLFTFNGTLDTKKNQFQGSFTGPNYSRGIFISKLPTNSVDLDLCFSGTFAGNAMGNISMLRDGNFNIVGCLTGSANGSSFSNYFIGAADGTSQFQITGLDNSGVLDPSSISVTGVISINGTTIGSGVIINNGCTVSLTRKPGMP